MNIKDRVALVTGSGAGIGEGIVHLLAENGAKIVVNDIDSAKVENVSNNLVERGFEAIGVTADISQSEQVNEMIKRTIEHYGKIDILVNNAAVVRNNLILNMPEEDFDIVMNVNLKGAWLCSKAVLGYMEKVKFGRIVNIASGSWLGRATQTNYAASKGGMISLTRSLAVEFAKDGVTVNCIAAGLIDTPMIQNLSPERRERLIKAQLTPMIGEPWDIANTVYFFASEEARYLTGQVLYVDGGKNIGARSL